MLTVQADNLSKKFGDFTAVDGISFNIEAGECFGFLGPNGAATSTMRMMRLRSPPQRRPAHQYLGLDARTQPREIKRRLGVAPQEDSLDHYLSVQENLVL